MRRLVPLFKPVYLPEMGEVADTVLRSGQIATGSAVAAFRQAFGRWIEQDQVALTSDMSSAMGIALHLCGVGPGSDVLTPAFACLSTNAPIANSGATPVWIDVDPRTGLIDPESLQRSITSRSKAVIAYHLAGYPCELESVLAVCREHGLLLIEDCNNALGARSGGAPIGAIGDFALYSFYPTRQLNGIEGGALVCKSPDHARRAQRLTRFGIDSATFRDAIGEIDPASQIDDIGWSAAMSNLHASVALAQMPSLDSRLTQAREVARDLSQRIGEIAGVTLVQATPGAVPAHWALLARVQSARPLLARLRSVGVQASGLHQRNDTYLGFRAEQRHLAGTDQWCESAVGLPCGWWMNELDTAYVAHALAVAVAA